MRIHHRRGAGIAAVVVPGLFVASVLAASVATQDKPPASGKPQRDPIVTPVTGPSWLNLLGVRYSDTTLGRSAATYAAPPGERAARPTPLPLAVGQPVVLSGADLYRLNCQACHRAEGTGSPPEIKAVLGLVQGTSLEIVRQQLRQQGRANAQSAARAQSAKARLALHDRVQKGGQRMPPLAHLQDADFDSLVRLLDAACRNPGCGAPDSAHRQLVQAGRACHQGDVSHLP